MPLRAASTSPSKGPAISMAFGVSMMLMGIAGWIYYPSIVDFEERKRQERERKQKALLEAVKLKDASASEQSRPSR
jgi:hypothetical protein